MSTAVQRPKAAKIDPVAIITATPEAMAWHVKIGWDFAPLWPSQRELLGLLRTERRVLYLKARQLRFTWTLALWALHRLMSRHSIAGAYVSIGQREAEDVTRRILRIHSSLPEAVRARYPLVAESLSRLAIGHPEGESELLSLPSSSNAGRGRTLDFLIGDERPKWPHPEEQEASLLPAAANGIVVMGGTANGFDTFQDRWHNAEEQGWATIFAGALSDPSRDLAWVMRERTMVGDLGPQEHPLSAGEAFLASGRCVFDVHALQDLLDHSCRRPETRVELRKTSATILAEPIVNGPWQVWEWPTEGRSYLIAADVCGGGGGDDFSAAAIYDADSWDQVASYHGRPEPDAFARELVRAGWVWRSAAGPALLVPESNNHGQAVVALLREWRYPRVYRTEAFDQRTQTTREQLGWLTTTKSRQLALDTLKGAVRDGALGIRDQAAVGEMFRFIDKDGREEADAGAHDDRVLTHAIAAAVLARSRASEAPPVRRPSAPYTPRISAKTGY
ncbi:MAG: hypothetical protein M3Q61_04035 [Chloroflexota bacterium]|nr:hypothetical protein [Chloroflexota bacterium]